MDALPALDSLAEAARAFGVSETHLAQLARKGKIPHYRIGTAVKVNLDELREHFYRPVVPTACQHEHVNKAPRVRGRRAAAPAIDYEALLEDD